MSVSVFVVGMCFHRVKHNYRVELHIPTQYYINIVLFLQFIKHNNNIILQAYYILYH